MNKTSWAGSLGKAANKYSKIIYNQRDTISFKIAHKKKTNHRDLNGLLKQILKIKAGGKKQRKRQNMSQKWDSLIHPPLSSVTKFRPKSRFGKA